MSLTWKAGLAVTAVAASTLFAAAQPMPEHQHMTGMHPQAMHGQGSMGRQEGAAQEPTLPGQDAFGAIQEVVKLLEADPGTDWSTVNIGALREHLIDMNEVTLHAAADERRLDNGIAVTVTGQGRVLDAIKRMVPAHSRELNGMNGWSATTEDLPNGVRLTVTTGDPAQIAKLQGLGFMGLMVQGSHHQPHHLAIATGRFQH